MGYQREDVLQKIDHLLNRTSPPQEIYEWALACAVSNEFDSLSQSDPLAARAVQTLMNVNEDRSITWEELKLLEYYRQCLRGQHDYKGDEKAAALVSLPADIELKWREFFAPQEDVISTQNNFLHLMRIYVYVFAVFVLVYNFWMLLQLGGPWSPKRSLAVMTFPFLVYGALLLLPLQNLVSGQLMLVIFPLSVLALGYYWCVCFQIIFTNGFHLIPFLMNFFLGAVPATAALGLLLHEKYLTRILQSKIPALPADRRP
ncbi:MAG TPA: hypothetical protein VLJ10_01080 [Candidatus Bathyarchaeia archaeon]|nr:hypothetical protein [Candidatus Bathyarchaeia archaeon]